MMVDCHGAPFFNGGLELSGRSRKKWLLVAIKPPTTKLKDCPCSNMVEVSISGSGGVLAAAVVVI